MAFIAVLVTVVSCEKTANKPAGKPVEKTYEIKVAPAAPQQLTAAGGSVSLTVTSDLDWTVENVPAWITVSPESGQASLTGQAVTLTVAENKGGVREVTLTFAIDGASQDVVISQNHNYGNDAPEGVIYYETLTESLGDFTVKDVEVPEPFTFIWEYTSQYQCAKATAYHNSTAKNYASESWLISPDIEMPAGKSAYFTFEHAGGYFGTAANEATVWVSKNSGDWEQLAIKSENYPTSWTFISAGNWDMTPYAGSTIKIAFKYSSTATKAGTWEVRNVVVATGSLDEIVVPTIDPKTTQWMELPTMTDAAYEYHSHSFEMNRNVYRNYSFAWSQDDLVSVWVAYPLCGLYTDGYVGRNEKWSYDPILGKDKSSYPGGGYAGDYDRGHQLPSADRQTSKTANEQTFYGSNIAPQLGGHNTTIWLTLEDKVRSIAAGSDTTYVVTGCVVKGAEEFSTDSNGKKITIPVAFYKALLRYKADGGNNEWVAAGFYTKHEKYTNNDLKAVSMSIDELEKLTGHDFFVNLAGKIGAEAAAAVEAQDPSTNAIWGL